MHRLLLAGLLSTGILAIGAAGTAQAMQPASNADLAAATGGYGPGLCTWGTSCTYSIPEPSAQDCIDGNVQQFWPCYSVIGTPQQNGSCVGKNGNCFQGGGQLCVEYQAGTCQYVTDADGGLMTGDCVPVNNEPTPINSRTICAQLPS